MPRAYVALGHIDPQRRCKLLHLRLMAGQPAETRDATQPIGPVDEAIGEAATQTTARNSILVPAACTHAALLPRSTIFGVTVSTSSIV